MMESFVTLGEAASQLLSLQLLSSSSLFGRHFWTTDLHTMSVAIVGNAACAVLGCFLVLRKMSLLGDAVSHSILAGIAAVFLLTGEISLLPMFCGAVAVGLLTAFLTQAVHDIGNVGEDSSMGIVFTSFFAIGVIIISQAKGVHLDADCVLYGRLDTVALELVHWRGWLITEALLTLLPVLAAVLLFVCLLWKELKISSFDAQLATTMGVSAMLIHYLLMTMVAVTTVSTLESVGAIVVVAMLIVPAATAHLLTDRLWAMLAVAVLVGTTAAIGGCLAARLWNSNAAGMMATIAGLQFLVVVFVAPRYGLLSKMVHQFRLALRIISEDVIAMLYRREERFREENPREEHQKAATVSPEKIAPENPVTATKQECQQAAGHGFLAKLAVPLLRRKQQLQRNAEGLFSLTEQGRSLGRSLVRSHRLWEAYLDENFALPTDHLHEPASRIEHFIGPQLQDDLAASLERPDRDPHGREIPVDDRSSQ